MRLVVTPTSKIFENIGASIDIDKRLFEKWSDMTEALNDTFLEDLDLETGKKTVSKTDFEKDRDSLIEHLREIS